MQPQDNNKQQMPTFVLLWNQGPFVSENIKNFDGKFASGIIVNCIMWRLTGNTPLTNQGLITTAYPESKQPILQAQT